MFVICIVGSSGVYGEFLVIVGTPGRVATVVVTEATRDLSKQTKCSASAGPLAEQLTVGSGATLSPTPPLLVEFPEFPTA